MRRQHWIVLHRWIGLVLAGFLILAGATGLLMPFYRDLDTALAARLLKAEVASGMAAPLDPLRLREQLLARHPGLRADKLPLAAEPGRSLMFLVQPDPAASGRPLPDVDEIYVDPYTGRELGGRRWGDLGQGSVNLMPFVYRLHYSLAGGAVGRKILGIVALLWAVNCFIGAYLTLPVRTPHRAGALLREGWWPRWRRAWALRLDARGHRLAFDLHRAGGLWAWALMCVIAWSAVAFNLPEVYRPVTAAAFGLHEAPRPRGAPLGLGEGLDWPQALARARLLMQDAARAERAAVLREESLALDRQAGAWRYVVTTDRDLRERGGITTLVFDARDGAPLDLRWPTGQRAGDTLTTWLTHVHMARIGGLPMRMLLSATALLVLLMSATGLTIWWRKRGGARRRHQNL